MYGATALNLILAIVLMKHPHSAMLYEHVVKVSPGWFTELVKSRLRRFAKERANEEAQECHELANFIKALLITPHEHPRSHQGRAEPYKPKPGDECFPRREITDDVQTNLEGG